MKMINAPGAPAAIGPYSHAAEIGGLVFCSGQIPIDPDTMKLVEGGIEVQTRQVLSNLGKVLEGIGANPRDVVKSTMFLVNLGDFALVNGLYAEFFGDHKPARSTIQVAALPLGSQVEIECIVAPGQG